MTLYDATRPQPVKTYYHYIFVPNRTTPHRERLWTVITNIWKPSIHNSWVSKLVQITLVIDVHDTLRIRLSGWLAYADKSSGTQVSGYARFDCTRPTYNTVFCIGRISNVRHNLGYACQCWPFKCWIILNKYQYVFAYSILYHFPIAVDIIFPTNAHIHIQQVECYGS